MLMAFENLGAAVWNFKSSKATERINCQGQIHCCKWSPDGLNFALGMRDGSVTLWKFEKNPQAYKSFRPDSDARDLNVTAIDTIFWLQSCMIISGGMPFTSPNQITILMGSELNNSQQLHLPSSVTPLEILHTPTEENENSFVLLSQSGGLLSFTLPDLKMKYVNDLYGGTEVLMSRFYTISNQGEEIIEIIEWLAPENRSRVLNGGEVVENPSDIYGLFVTAHVAGVIRFWSVSTVRIYNILNLSIISEEYADFYNNTVYNNVSDIDGCKISCIEVLQKKIIVGFDMGKIGVWEIAPQKLNILCVYQYHISPVLSASLSGDLIITGDMDGVVTVYNISNAQALVTDLKALGCKKEKTIQNISVTYMQNILSVVYIGLSNGAIFLYDGSTQQFCQVPKLERADFKSELPKKSEVGVLKLLHTCINPNLIIVCYERAMTVNNSNDFSVNIAQYWTTPMVSASIAHIRSEVYIYIMHADGVISMLEYLSLKRVWKGNIPLPLQ